MLCSKCGKEITEADGKCLNCENLEMGQTTDKTTVEPIIEHVSNTTVQQSEVVASVEQKIEIAESVPAQPVVQESQPSVPTEKKEKKKSKIFNVRNLIILISFVVVIIIGIVLYGIIVGFEKLEWDNTYKASSLDYVTPSVIQLGVRFSNNEKIDKIKYETTCGELEVSNDKLTWNLKDSIGECQITASYKKKIITKKFTVISAGFDVEELSLKYEIDLDSDEDLDFDGLTNKQEKEYNTNPLLADSDMDGLNDDYEIFVSKTDPNKADTDGDGLSDYDELQLGLDPLKADSKGDGIKDGERELTYNYKNENIELEIKGKGNIASTIAEINSNTKISSKTGLIDNLYIFYTDGTLKEATVKIKYTDEELTKYNLNEDRLSIYYYNEKTSKYEKVETTIDKENKTLIAKLTHFSMYVVGDEALVKEESSTQILFILDNSWSMYSNEQYKELTGEEYNGGLFGSSILDASDEEGVRFGLTADLAEKLNSKKYEIGLSEFRSDYANAVPIGKDIKSIKKTLETMNGNFITSSAGTNINNALTNGIKEFSENIDNKYIVILTDGMDSSLSSYRTNIIENALDKSVKICSVGFGEGSNNSPLADISNATGCKFFSSSDSSGLEELFDNIDTELNNDLIDMDNDGNNDGILLADSGFIVNRDGFSFQNYGTNLSSGGHCFGMATFAELYYTQKLPLSSKAITSGKDTSYAYNLNNTYFKNYSNLYDFKLTTNVLKHTFGYTYFDEETPIDYRILEDNVLKFNSKYRKELKDSDFYDILKEKSGLSKEQQLAKWGVNYNSAENALINEDRMQNSSQISKDEKEMFNAIYTSFIKQNSESFYTSSTDFTLWLRNVIGTESTAYTGEEGFINILKARLSSKDPLVISSSFSGGLHAINAINLIQDIDNPNHYYIGVYDNNYPGEKRYVDIICKKDQCVTQANEYYSNSNQPIRITPSLEHDLAYYNQ